MNRLWFDDEGLCGAAMISPEWALTAQHCVEGTNNKDFRVTFNSNYFDGRGGFTTPISQIQRLPGYDRPSLRNDVALLRLTNRAPASIPPVRLALTQSDRDAVRVGANATIMGWGRWAEDTKKSNFLNTGTTRITAIDPVYTRTRPIDPAFGTWTGSGDSGGPLLLTTPADLTQIGVVSGGPADDPQLDVFNRVDPGGSQWAWISATTGIRTQDPRPSAPRHRGSPRRRFRPVSASRPGRRPASRSRGPA